MHVSAFQGVKVYRAVPVEKRTKKDGTLRPLKKLGRVHLPVFSPDGMRVVGFMVKRPDVAGMIKQEDCFIAIDAIDIQDDQLVVADTRESYDSAAAKRLGVDLDACLVWTGMDVVTASGERLGYCSDAVCDSKTGMLQTICLTPSAASSALIGHMEMPVELLLGYRHGAMYVEDSAASLGFSGGAAAKAAEATVHVKTSVKKGAKVIDEKGSEAVEKGSRALGKRIGETGQGFKGFSEEFKKAAGTAPSKKAPANKTGDSKGAASSKTSSTTSKQKGASAARAVGKQLGKTKGMFSAFADEFKKASAPSSGAKKTK
ncbi:MAG: PRC-barrel domain containing protein [Coriobacteriaceae bacterium]|nr:PRC-barrel domain containing protein [Coriobacteriaceae bacterium]